MRKTHYVCIVVLALTLGCHPSTPTEPTLGEVSAADHFDPPNVWLGGYEGTWGDAEARLSIYDVRELMDPIVVKGEMYAGGHRYDLRGFLTRRGVWRWEVWRSTCQGFIGKGRMALEDHDTIKGRGRVAGCDASGRISLIRVCLEAGC